MRDTIFIVSQPLQILVALSIIKQLGIDQRSYLAIVGTFYNARLVYERLATANWELSPLSIKFFESHKDANKFIIKSRASNLFTDGDVSVKKYLELQSIKLRRKSITINVYEEGLGTYRTDLYSGLKKRILNLLGVGTNYGGCILTDSLYLFNPDLYKNTFPKSQVKLVQIAMRPVDIISSYFDSLSFIFDHSPISRGSEDVCHVYLSSWGVDYDFLKEFSKLRGDKYIKLHPRAKAIRGENYGVMVSRTPPAEMVLLDMMGKYKTVNVYHHGSSVEKYFSEKNVVFLKV